MDGWVGVGHAGGACTLRVPSLQHPTPRAHKVAKGDAVHCLLAKPGVGRGAPPRKVAHNPCGRRAGERQAGDCQRPSAPLACDPLPRTPPPSLTWDLLQQRLGKVAQHPGEDEGKGEEHAPSGARRGAQRLLGHRRAARAGARGGGGGDAAAQGAEHEHGLPLASSPSIAWGCGGGARGVGGGARGEGRGRVRAAIPLRPRARLRACVCACDHWLCGEEGEQGGGRAAGAARACGGGRWQRAARGRHACSRRAVPLAHPPGHCARRLQGANVWHLPAASARACRTARPRRPVRACRRRAGRRDSHRPPAARASITAPSTLHRHHTNGRQLCTGTPARKRRATARSQPRPAAMDKKAASLEAGRRKVGGGGRWIAACGRGMAAR